MMLICRLRSWLFVGLLLVAQTWATTFNSHILHAVQSMPTGGGYASDRAAEVRLARSGIVWQAQAQQLVISPRGAAPTFCSAACYAVLLRALASWESEQGRSVFSPKVWEALRVEELHPDGYLSWGRFNSNGPGCAKWVNDLRAGVNFTDLSSARPGDFLKLFFTPTVGAKERGHLVIFLGFVQLSGQPHIRYWSSNKPAGYSVRSVPLASARHILFTRITHPERICGALALPPHDFWLAAMLTQSFCFPEVCRKCGVSSTATASSNRDSYVANRICP